MAVYVDDPIWPWKGQMWCHLLADSLDELHAFAKSLGLRREWFQGHTRYPHYDINESRRGVALLKGAIEIDKRTTIDKARKLKVEFDLIKSQKNQSLITPVENGISEQPKKTQFKIYKQSTKPSIPTIIKDNK